MLSRPGDELRGILPFLIEDVTPREERVPRVTTHENGASGLDTLTVAVADSSTVCGWYVDILHDEGAEIERVEMDAAGRRFLLGTHHLDVLAPRASTGAVHDWLRRRGPSVYGATVTSVVGGPMALETNPNVGRL